MSDRSWRDAFFGGRRDALSRLGLVPAPRRETPSHELTAARELEQKQIEHERLLDQRFDEETCELWRQRRIEELRGLIAEFGREAVVKLSRRSNPRFELPVELREDEQ